MNWTKISFCGFLYNLKDNLSNKFHSDNLPKMINVYILQGSVTITTANVPENLCVYCQHMKNPPAVHFVFILTVKIKIKHVLQNHRNHADSYCCFAFLLIFFFWMPD